LPKKKAIPFESFFGVLGGSYNRDGGLLCADDAAAY